MSGLPAAARAQRPDGDEPPVPTPDSPLPALLAQPRDGIPPVLTRAADLDAARRALAAGRGPLAVDAERASGYRYGNRAYLVQLRRDGAGTVLVDPTALPDLSALGHDLAGAEWVLHAAGQDLPCLAEVGLRPARLFDTELAGRLAGYPRVALGTLTEQLLGVRLAKEHSAADWSQRPLPAPLLAYAALDVELLADLRDVLGAVLTEQGKAEWARQEFQALLDAPTPARRPDPWRRVSGIHQVRSRRGLAVVRELWAARDDLARERDRGPGRVLPDRVIVALAEARVRSVEDVRTIIAHDRRAADRDAVTWLAAVRSARALPEEDLPVSVLPSDGPPPAARWADRDPAAAARLSRARARLGALAETHRLPVENLLLPELVRRLAWSPPEPLSEEAVAQALADGGARPWQVDLTSAVLAAAFAAPS